MKKLKKLLVAAVIAGILLVPVASYGILVTCCDNPMCGCAEERNGAPLVGWDCWCSSIEEHCFCTYAY